MINLSQEKTEQKEYYVTNGKTTWVDFDSYENAMKKAREEKEMRPDKEYKIIEIKTISTITII